MSTFDPTALPKLFATSLAPTANARTKATTKPTTIIHSSDELSTKFATLVVAVLKIYVKKVVLQLVINNVSMRLLHERNSNQTAFLTINKYLKQL